MHKHCRIYPLDRHFYVLRPLARTRIVPILPLLLGSRMPRPCPLMCRELVIEVHSGSFVSLLNSWRKVNGHIRSLFVRVRKRHPRVGAWSFAEINMRTAAPGNVSMCLHGTNCQGTKPVNTGFLVSGKDRLTTPLSKRDHTCGPRHSSQTCGRSHPCCPRSVPRFAQTATWEGRS